MTRKTSFDELYTTIGAIVTKATGRKWWKTKGIQAAPSGVYSLISLRQGAGLESQVVESIEITPPPAEGSEIFRQTPWNTTKLNCLIEFFRSGTNDRAIDAATRFRSALFLEERFLDLWIISGLVGQVGLTDISSIFRSDTEPRAEISFTVYCNLADPAPLDGTDIFDIGSQEIDVKFNHVDETVTTIPITVDDN